MNLIFKIFLFCLIAYNCFSKEDSLSNSKIELMIEEYLLKNPEVIIKSLENYRNKQQAKMEENSKISLNNYYEERVYETLPYTGNTSGKVVITEFIDYNCGYCKKTLNIIIELLSKNNDLKVVFVDFPILSETSYVAAQGALAAFEQNAYFKFHSELLKGNRDFSEAYILEIAENLKLDTTKFIKDMKSNFVSEKLKANIKFARELNIRGTPSFIIDKKIYPGAYEIVKLEEIIKNNK